MGRSVSVPCRAFAVVYEDITWVGYRNEDDEGNPIEEPEFDEVLGQMDWEDWVECQKEKVKAIFPSMEDCNEWIDREDHAVLQNRFAYFGISEYLGCASLWLVLKDNLDSYYSHENLVGLAEQWSKKAEVKFEKEMGTMVRVGGFSNGESVYERKQ